MNQLQKKSFTTSRSLEYSYRIHYGQSSAPALLLQHGFPDDHNLWAKILLYLLNLPYSIVVPDLLGYGGTAKPVDAKLYNSKAMTEDLVELLDHEQIGQFISIGHDWGSYLASRQALFHPERVAGLIMLNVAYLKPAPVDVDQINQHLERTTGLPRLAYQKFFVSSQAARLVQDTLESFFHALFGSDEGTTNWMEDILCHTGALEKFVREDRRHPLKEFAQDQVFKEAFITRLQRDGIEGPFNWYHAFNDNIHWEVERTLSDEQLRITVPVLFVGSSKDAVARTENIYPAQKDGLLPDLTVKEVESGHWQTYEVPDQTGPIIRSWLEERVQDLMGNH